MLLDFKELIIKYNLNIQGVIHVGGHTGEEIPVYQKHNIDNVVFFEPDPRNVSILDNKIKNTNYIIKPVGLGNENSKKKMYISSNDHASNSVLKPKLHLQQYPHITFNDEIEIFIYKLDDYSFYDKYNFMNIDVQGYELEVLKGSKNTLKYIDGIICEVNRDEVYENCPHIDDIDNFLKDFNFERVETSWDGNIWGDAFYKKQ